MLRRRTLMINKNTKPLTFENSTPEQFDVLWGEKGFADRGVGRKEIAHYYSLHYGGLPGDWVKNKKVPDIPAEELMTISLDEIKQWIGEQYSE